MKSPYRQHTFRFTQTSGDSDQLAAAVWLRSKVQLPISGNCMSSDAGEPIREVGWN
jgi:hypothetical protein